ncbi:MAG: TatD family hydrolase [Archaeoglobaceae archaeon]|nr:TatD family hydrolase [Archaeoglobaceae archaeon]
MFFDSHVHSEGLGLSEMEIMRDNGITEICSLYFYPIKPLFPQTVIDGFRRLEEFEKFRCSIVGIKMYPAVGIHPRCIPPDYKTVIEHLEARDWIAFGEIGLETANEIEQDVFRRQLMVAIEKDIPCIIHTPRKNKREITKKTLEILMELNFPQDLAIIDHVNFENLDLVAKSEFWIGLSVQKEKLAAEDAVIIVREVGEDRCIVNSDAGFVHGDFLGVVETAKLLDREAKKVCFENVKKLLGV